MPIQEVAKEGDKYKKGGRAFYIREGEHTLRRVYARVVIERRKIQQKEQQVI